MHQGILLFLFLLFICIHPVWYSLAQTPVNSVLFEYQTCRPFTLQSLDLGLSTFPGWVVEEKEGGEEKGREGRGGERREQTTCISGENPS